jgi:phosphonate transport system substrate-binding protein
MRKTGRLLRHAAFRGLRSTIAMKKSLLLILVSALIFISGTMGTAAAGRNDLRFAITGAVASDPSFENYRELSAYVANKVGRRAVFISGLSYSQVDNMFFDSKVDVGFLCNAHYARRKTAVKFVPIAAPIVEGYGKPKFRVYIIVRKDSALASLNDLRGKSVDFADPLSTTSIYAAYMLKQRHEAFKSFFGKTIYSGSHDMTIQLVAAGLVDAGFIDGQIWDYDQKKNAQYSSKTKVIYKSEEFTIPPVVVSGTMDSTLRKQLTRVFLDMHKEAEGREILRKLRIDKFVKIKDEDYRDVRRVYDAVKGSP